MDINRLKELSGVSEVRKPKAPEGSELSIWDIDGMTVGDLINHLQSYYDVSDKISVGSQWEYGRDGGHDRDAIMIIPQNSA